LSEKQEGIYSRDKRKSFIDYLDECGLEAYQELFEMMTSPKFNLSEEKAHEKASEIMAKNIRILNSEKDQQHFEAYGWVKVYSTKIEQAVYFVKDKELTCKLPDKSLPVFTQKDIEALKGLDSKEMALIMEAKALFGGDLKIEET